MPARRRLFLRLASWFLKLAGGAVVTMEVKATRPTQVHIDLRQILDAAVSGKIGPSAAMSSPAEMSVQVKEDRRGAHLN